MKLRLVLLVVAILAGFWLVAAYWGGPRSMPVLRQALDRLPVSLSEASAAPEYDAEELNNIAVYKRGLPSVVNITSTAVAFDFWYGAVPQQGQGSGFILDRAGHVLTNYHVIADANRIEVTTSDKHKYKAQIVGEDKSHDLALLAISAPNLEPATLADSSHLVVGQKVYAIGNPFGLSGTMTHGIISSIRSVRGPQGTPIEDAIQTDAAINPGNSGGPLLNSRGEVIGINSMIASNGADQNSGVGFAIPINTAKAVLADLEKYGRVRRPSLGMASIGVSSELAAQMGLPAVDGVLIQRVTRGGAAERAGLRGGTQQGYVGNTPIILGGDLIVAIDGQPVSDPQDIAFIMEKHKSGDAVSVTFYRGQRKMSTQMVLGEGREFAT